MMNSKNPLVRKLVFFILMIIIFVLLGAFGFKMSEGISTLDSIWLSIMTVTTVGYQVPENFSNTGKIISIFLMLFGVGTVLYILTDLAVDLFNGTYFKIYKEQRITKKIKNLENHYIICGFGRNGRQAARKLISHKKSLIIVDSKILNNRDDEFGKETIFLTGNATEDEVLFKAGLPKAKGIIAALPSDADNLYIVLTAKQANPSIKIISRASNSNSVSKLKTAGADNVIMPDKIGGEHMASLLITPDLVEFMDYITLEGTKEINLLELYTNRLESTYMGKKILDLPIEKDFGCKIIGFKDAKKNYFINPDPNTILEENSCLILLGQPQQILQIKKHYLHF